MASLRFSNWAPLTFINVFWSCRDFYHPQYFGCIRLYLPFCSVFQKYSEKVSLLTQSVESNIYFWSFINRSSRQPTKWQWWHRSNGWQSRGICTGAWQPDALEVYACHQWRRGLHWLQDGWWRWRIRTSWRGSSTWTFCCQSGKESLDSVASDVRQWVSPWDTGGDGEAVSSAWFLFPFPLYLMLSLWNNFHHIMCEHFFPVNFTKSVLP